MKLRTSYFDKSVLRKDITRFAPLWGLYLIGGLLVALTIAGNSGRYYHLARNLNSVIGPFGIISLCYAFLVAQLLFGDLFNTRLCNALHAMPLRREGWFLTHITAGLLFSLVPNLIMSIAIMPFLGKLWYTALLWYLGMTLHYVFFFGLAVFCMMLTGNRFAAAAVYVILNFLSLIVMWFATVLYEPMMYGVVIRNDGFDLFSPVVALCQCNSFFTVDHMVGCHCGKNGLLLFPVSDGPCIYEFTGLGESWIYPSILAALGVLLGIAALALYRKRHLESAGDFIAFKSVRPVFSIVYTLCVGALAQIFGDLFSVPFYIFLFIGLLVGFFTGQMLLNRTARVFKKRSWLAVALILVLVFGSLGLFQADAFGIVRWTPKAENVVSFKVAHGNVDNFNEYNTDAEFSDQAAIEEMIAIHKLLIAEGPEEDRVYQNGFRTVSICYTLENGREVYRQYKATRGGRAMQMLDDLVFHNPVYILRAADLEELKAKVSEVSVEGLSFYGAKKDSLLAALWVDGQAGTLNNLDDYKMATYQGYVQLYYKDSGYMSYLEIYSSNQYTTKWIKDTLSMEMSVDEMMKITSFFQIGYASLDWNDYSLMESFCKLFVAELGTGIVEGKQPGGIFVEAQRHSGVVYDYTVLEGSELYEWILRYLPEAVPQKEG